MVDGSRFWYAFATFSQSPGMADCMNSDTPASSSSDEPSSR